MKLKPTKEQLKFLDWEMGLFFHFGIRSFYVGHRDWDNQEMSLSAFNPESLDCEQWIREAKEAGFKYTILTCKHHDGFAIWPSKYTEYSVKNTPWKDGKGDVVREYVDACRKYDMGVGLYYSPAQWGESAVHFENAKDYDDYFINQLGELLTNYGKVDYLWFDGCGSEGHEFDTDRIVKEIRRMQPGILIFNMWDPDTRWVGNEDGYADMNNPYTVYGTKFSIFQDEGDRFEKAQFLPAECDFQMRATWFDCEINEDSIKTADELFGIYEYSVGRGANFLLNIGPDRHGRLPYADVVRLREFAARVREVYGEAIDFGDVTKATDRENVFEIVHPTIDYKLAQNLPNPSPLCNRVVIEEDITDGQSVKEFRLYAQLPRNRNRRICVYKGDTVGHKVICSFPTVKSARFVLEVTDAEGEVKIKSMKAYYAQ